MINILNGNWEQIADFIKREKKRMYFWGTGVMLQICMEQIVRDLDLWDCIGSVTDADINKVGKKVKFGSADLKIIGTEEFIKSVYRDSASVLVITCSFFYSIVESLDSQTELDGKECFIVPLVFLENPMRPVLWEKPLGIEDRIPKIIHYCWFGGSELPEKLQRCIKTWSEKCPDYEICLWNEGNVDLNSSPWLKHFSNLKNWAFVSDYVRAKVLYEYGGLYFDTDVEILENFDDFLHLEAFAGYEKWPVINTGGGCGSVSGFWIWREIMSLKDCCTEQEYVIPSASGYYDTLPLIQKGLKADGTLQQIEGFTVLPSEFFQPFDYVSLKVCKSVNTHSIHYFNWSWADGMMKEGSRRMGNQYQCMMDRVKLIS